jgi:glycosyltransferase involved in cell wall biosynthesis
MRNTSIALVHDWLEAPGGGEAVLSELVRMYPSADVYALVDFLTPAERAKVGVGKVTTSALQRMPAARHWFRYAALLYPDIVERFELSRYDLIISDSHAVAKGVRKNKNQLHLCYCYTPARFAWTMAETYGERAAGRNRWLTPLVRHAMARFRSWDRAASERVDHFFASSQHIARVIADCYGRRADVIYPPVDVARFALAGNGAHTGPYVTVSRLVPYKRIDLLVEAFRRMPLRQLVVVGDGPERRNLARHLPFNVTLAGRLNDADCAALVGNARAFVFAAMEDFGIAPIEAQAAGTPVIAYRGGAMNETIIDLNQAAPTGVLYDRQTPEAIIAAVERFERDALQIDRNACRANALRFRPERFRAEFHARVEAALAMMHGEFPMLRPVDA